MQIDSTHIHTFHYHNQSYESCIEENATGHGIWYFGIWFFGVCSTGSLRFSTLQWVHTHTQMSWQLNPTGFQSSGMFATFSFDL